MFRVSNKDIRTTFSSVFIGDFEQVIVCLVTPTKSLFL